MDVWIVNSRGGNVLPAMLLRRLDDEEMLVRLEDGERITVPRRVVFECVEEAQRALADARGSD